MANIDILDLPFYASSNVNPDAVARIHYKKSHYIALSTILRNPDKENLPLLGSNKVLPLSISDLEILSRNIPLRIQDILVRARIKAQFSYARLAHSPRIAKLHYNRLSQKLFTNYCLIDYGGLAYVQDDYILPIFALTDIDRVYRLFQYRRFVYVDAQSAHDEEPIRRVDTDAIGTLDPTSYLSTATYCPVISLLFTLLYQAIGEIAGVPTSPDDVTSLDDATKHPSL
jgi:hypothetical protein